MRRVSTGGAVSAILYLAFTVFCVARAEYCFHNHDLFCLIGYLIPAMPWILIFFLLSSLLRESGQLLWSVAFYIAVTLSVSINTLLVYRFGRIIGAAVERRKS